MILATDLLISERISEVFNASKGTFVEMLREGMAAASAHKPESQVDRNREDHGRD